MHVWTVLLIPIDQTGHTNLDINPDNIKKESRSSIINNRWMKYQTKDKIEGKIALKIVWSKKELSKY